MLVGVLGLRVQKAEPSAEGWAQATRLLMRAGSAQRPPLARRSSHLGACRLPPSIFRSSNTAACWSSARCWTSWAQVRGLRGAPLAAPGQARRWAPHPRAGVAAAVRPSAPRPARGPLQRRPFERRWSLAAANRRRSPTAGPAPTQTARRRWRPSPRPPRSPPRWAWPRRRRRTTTCLRWVPRRAVERRNLGAGDRQALISRACPVPSVSPALLLPTGAGHLRGRPGRAGGGPRCHAGRWVLALCWAAFRRSVASRVLRSSLPPPHAIQHCRSFADEAHMEEEEASVPDTEEPPARCAGSLLGARAHSSSPTGNPAARALVPVPPTSAGLPRPPRLSRRARPCTLASRRPPPRPPPLLRPSRRSWRCSSSQRTLTK